MMTCWMLAFSCRARATIAAESRAWVSPPSAKRYRSSAVASASQRMFTWACPEHGQVVDGELRVDLDLGAAQPGVERVVVDAVHQPDGLLGGDLEGDQEARAPPPASLVLTLGAVAAGGVRTRRPWR